MLLWAAVVPCSPALTCSLTLPWQAIRQCTVIFSQIPCAVLENRVSRLQRWIADVHTALLELTAAQQQQSSRPM